MRRLNREVTVNSNFQKKCQFNSHLWFFLLPEMLQVGEKTMFEGPNKMLWFFDLNVWRMSNLRKSFGPWASPRSAGRPSVDILRHLKKKTTTFCLDTQK